MPCHSCTPMMPKMKNTKKQSRRTLPSIGSVSSSSMTRIRIPEIFSWFNVSCFDRHCMQIIHEVGTTGEKCQVLGVLGTCAWRARRVHLERWKNGEIVRRERKSRANERIIFAYCTSAAWSARRGTKYQRKVRFSNNCEIEITKELANTPGGWRKLPPYQKSLVAQAFDASTPAKRRILLKSLRVLHFSRPRVHLCTLRTYPFPLRVFSALRNVRSQTL